MAKIIKFPTPHERKMKDAAENVVTAATGN